ncbi:hypothetical protein DPMN_140948 [Dreissena polymorpha]|uniref:Mab-21-like HhH/H2TH-like domain-containing protein n=1 Tax=Dreissena polymorpha TaxID=45954 RepID=A0A9D4G8P3_DREPO|nr:hypothetical protein DPMN_140948 [Dreissena polymorpha]
MEGEPDTINNAVHCLTSMPESLHETGTHNKVRFPSSELNLGAKRVFINVDPPRRSNTRWDQHLVKNLLTPEYFPALSIRISDVLDDIGAGKCFVMERRDTYLRREHMMTIAQQLLGKDQECFHFGSQSEGTTTPGLNSDVDALFSDKRMNIMTGWRDWEAGMDNLLMLRDDITPPQQYLLQVIKRYTPEEVTRIDDDRFVKKDSGQVLFSSERWKQEIAQDASKFGEVTTNGPSVSCVSNWDVVMAFPVCKPLPEIQHWIDRCRGRHWPHNQIIEASRKAPCFMVPAGHPDSEYKREEWRLSPNLIERMLMFSFNMTQIKCYIVLKFIKKSLFGDFITSFHCKTLVFYTIERAHPSLWKENNLMFLLLLCLKVLRTWLRLGFFPHYIIEGVNLFDGKLSFVQQRHLLQYVNYLIKNDLQDLFHIDIDNLGRRLQACCIHRIRQGVDGELGGVVLRYSISLLLKYGYLGTLRNRMNDIMYKIQSSNSTFKQCLQNKLRTDAQFYTNAELETVAFDVINHLYIVQNAVQSAKCLRLPNPAFSKIIRRFKFCLSTDIASNRLKLASMLYCFGHLHAAVRVLGDVEKRYHSKVKAVCGVRQVEGEGDLQVFADMMSDNIHNLTFSVLSEPPFAFCVRFIRHEAHCAPYILWFEMNRSMTEEEVAQRSHWEKTWMDNAEVDARPFLYYLQYITYKGLGERTKQLHALNILGSYILDPRNSINLYHPETAYSLLGHCYEMEGDFENALYTTRCLRVVSIRTMLLTGTYSVCSAL